MQMGRSLSSTNDESHRDKIRPALVPFQGVFQLAFELIGDSTWEKSLLLTYGDDIAQLFPTRRFFQNYNFMPFQGTFNCSSKSAKASTDYDDLDPSFGVFSYRRRH